MKKALLLAAAITSAVSLSGCAVVSAPLFGLYTDVTYPVEATSNEPGPKTGEASASSILGIIATGDASVAAAAKAGGITKIKTVDVQAKNYLFFYAKYTVIVTGE